MGKYGAGTTFLQRAVADVICGELPTAPSTAVLQVEQFSSTRTQESTASGISKNAATYSTGNKFAHLGEI